MSVYEFPYGSKVPEASNASEDKRAEWSQYVRDHKIVVREMLDADVSLNPNDGTAPVFVVYVARKSDEVAIRWTGFRICEDEDEVSTAVTYFEAEYCLHGIDYDGWEW